MIAQASRYRAPTIAGARWAWITIVVVAATALSTVAQQRRRSLCAPAWGGRRFIRDAPSMTTHSSPHNTMWAVRVRLSGSFTFLLLLATSLHVQGPALASPCD